MSVKKIDGTSFGYQLIYGDYYEAQSAAEQTFIQGKKMLNTTYLCYYDDTVMPIKVQFSEESDRGFYIATAVVGGIGGLCYLVHIALEIYWKWLYRNENREDNIEMK